LKETHDFFDSMGLLFDLLLIVHDLSLEDELAQTSQEHVIPVYMQDQQDHELVDEIVLTPKQLIFVYIAYFASQYDLRKHIKPCVPP
jgi:hypothetical protein